MKLLNETEVFDLIEKFDFHMAVNFMINKKPFLIFSKWSVP